MRAIITLNEINSFKRKHMRHKLINGGNGLNDQSSNSRWGGLCFTSDWCHWKKKMNPLLFPAMSKIVGQTGLFSLVKATSLRERIRRTEFKPWIREFTF